MNVRMMWDDSDAIGGFIEGVAIFCGRSIIGQTGIVGLIGSWLGA